MTRRLYIFGTGAHARKVFHCASALGWAVAGFVDEAPAARAPVRGGVVVALPAAPPADAAVFVAIGRAEVRRRLNDMLAAAGWALPALVHPRAWVAPDARLAEGVLVAAGAVVETGAHVGTGAIVDIGALVDHDAAVGAYVHLRAGEVCGPREQRPPAA